MKHITIKRIDILNFKGIRSLTINFSEYGATNIYGANGAGKSTIADAFRWCLTGKDSADRANFEVKPTDNNGNVIGKLENEVTVTLAVNGNDTVLRRTNKEKWVTKRGSAHEEFQGNETKFYIDEVPHSLKEYQAKVGDIVSEQTLKMLSDTTYFNTQMSWQDRRSILTKVAGDLTDEYILSQWKPSHPSWKAFVESVIFSKKTFAERVKELTNKRKLALEEKESIPNRIDEVKRGMPIPVPYERIKADLGKAEKELADIDAQIVDRNNLYKAQEDACNEKRKELLRVQNEIAAIERAHTSAYNNDLSKASERLTELKNKLEVAQKGLDSTHLVISNIASRKKTAQEKIEHLRHQIQQRAARREDLLLAWKSRNAEQLVFDEDSCTCPTCKQVLPEAMAAGKRDDALEAFNKKKQADLNGFVNEAEALKKANELDENDISITKEQLTALLDEANNVAISATETGATIENLKAAIESEKSSDKKAPASVQDRLDSDTRYRLLATEKWKLETDIAEFKPVDISELVAQRNAILPTIEAYKADLLIEGQIKKANERIAELESQEQTLAQTISEYEQEQFAIAEFMKAKMSFVEESVNSMFSLVKWRMFREQINGGEEPVCDCLVNGVEYTKNLNTAARINAGLDVINVLSKHYHISLPVFCDNRESVTDLIPTEAQVINLIVSPADKELRVEYDQKAEVA